MVSLDIVSWAFVCFGILGFVGLFAAHTCADHQIKKTCNKDLWQFSRKSGDNAVSIADIL
jgi:hypothetical protein